MVEQTPIDLDILAQIRAIAGAKGLCESSADVANGDVFIACAVSAAQRQQHIEQAVQNGAVGLIIDTNVGMPSAANLPVVRVAGLSAHRGSLASAYYADPSKDIECVGITGTNGKTSIAYHVANLSSLLESRCGYSGTLGWGTLGSLTVSGMTTASPVALQRQFAHFAMQGIQRVALEVSSHALAQGRALDAHIDVGVFSNLSRDHLDYHQSMEQYAAAKARLFSDWPLKLAVVNADDEMGRRLLTCARAGEVLSYGLSADISWRATAIRTGMHVLFDTPWGRLESALPVAAEFAIANVAAAIGVLLGLGCSLQDLAKALSKLRPVPGRMQVIDGAYGTPKVIVDYAHTPDAVVKVLASLAPLCRGRLICVVGCGGNRDRGKRPEMAQAAASLCDELWLTSDNPRDEDPAIILQDMLSGLTEQQRQSVIAVEDRKAAIAGSIKSAGASDLIVIAGKGHESTQEIAGVKHPFSDAMIVENLLKEIA